ncbi:MAG: methionine synthase [Clostridia bacterium]|nr:methionine synthase [Clostridia bacterium]
MKIDKNEVLRYLGYKNQQISDDLHQKIDFLIQNAAETLKPKAVWDIFQPEFSEKVILKNTCLQFEGQDIFNHLKGAKKVAVMAVTLGIGAERAILKYQHTDMVSTVISDAVFDAFIECVADETEQQIKELAQKEGLYINSRYSPGYGDFPLNTQKMIISALNCEKKIGLTVTESDILVPRKSVTAVIGFFSEIQNKPFYKCLNCNMKDKCKMECDKNV